MLVRFQLEYGGHVEVAADQVETLHEGPRGRVTLHMKTSKKWELAAFETAAAVKKHLWPESGR